jgi:hypothetical protein
VAIRRCISPICHVLLLVSPHLLHAGLVYLRHQLLEVAVGALLQEPAAAAAAATRKFINLHQHAYICRGFNSFLQHMHMHSAQ